MKKVKNKRQRYFFAFVLFSHLSFADILVDIRKSAETHFPDIIVAIQDVEMASQKVVAAKGAFDFKLKSKFDDRPVGYYNGQAIDTTIEKPIGILNADLYGGWKQSRGEFPTYEGKVDTLEDGEYRMGLSMSVLRDRGIDSRRFELESQKRYLNIAKLRLEEQKQAIVKESLVAFWEWYSQLKVTKVVERLYNIAVERQAGIKKRVQRGDTAKIYLTENQQYIVKRKALLIKEKQKLLEKQLKLSLFYRDAQANPVLITEDQLDKNFSVERHRISDEFYKQALDLVETSNFKVNQIVEMNNRIQIEEKLNENQMLPKLDLKYEVSRDEGAGSSTLRPTENRVMLNFEFPLENRKARGKRGVTRAKIKQLAQKKKFVIEKQKLILQKFYNQTNNFLDVLENAETEIDLANKLEVAERRRFQSGASDFFVLNLREENTVDAQVKFYKALLAYKYAKENFRQVAQLY